MSDTGRGAALSGALRDARLRDHHPCAAPAAVAAPGLAPACHVRSNGPAALIDTLASLPGVSGTEIPMMTTRTPEGGAVHRSYAEANGIAD